MFEGFQKFFSKQPQSVVGIDIGSSSIKVVQLRREHGSAILETYGAVALGPYGQVEIGRATQLQPDVIATALSDVLRESNVSTLEAAFAVPYSSSLVSVIKLPVVAEGKLDQIMPLEARKYIPVPIEEVQLDWSIVSGGDSASPDGKIEVMLAAIQNNTLEKYRHIAQSVSLHPTLFEIEVFSAVRSSLEHGIAPVAVVDIGAATIKVYIVERGLVRESHIINHGSQELTLNASRSLLISITQAEEYKRKMGLEAPKEATTIPGSHTTTADILHSFELTCSQQISDLSRTISSFEQRMGEAIGTIVFTGGGSELRGLAQFMQTRVQGEVVLADPFHKTQAPAFLDDILKSVGPEFSVAVGVALRKLQEL
ncbi:MAG TPA: type IV pilus assembly protein PilM [Candidatus Paceibacterota bacterium]